MHRTRIHDLPLLVDRHDPVLLRGWVRTRRDSKACIFLTVNDGSTQAGIQVVVDHSIADSTDVKSTATGSAVEVEGRLVDSPGGKQQVEIAATAVRLVGEANAESYPIQKKQITLETLRDIAHLRPRTNTFGSVFRIRHTAAMAIHEFFDSHGFYYIHTPIITAADAEGAGELFRVTTLDINHPPRTAQGEVDFHEDFFAREAFLTVSGQLAVENFCSALGDVYTFGPTFRAENSNTPRHLAEFWMVEPEIAFADLDDDAHLAEDFLKFIIRRVMERNEADLAFLAKQYDAQLPARLQAVVESRFARITYTEAIDLLLQSGRTFDYPISWGKDLQTEHERFLCEEHFAGPTIVTDYPKEIKAFYMKQNSDGRTVRAMDILSPGIGEIIGGSQREESYDALVSRMTELGMDLDVYDWYLDLRRYGSHPHAGFGLGFERFVQFVTGMSNIRDVIPFPRTPGNARY